MRLVFLADHFGATVREHRGRLTLRQAADAAGAAPATLSRVERGELPDVPMLLKLCTWLGRSPDEFIGRELELVPGRAYCFPPTPPTVKRLPRREHVA